MFYMPCFLDRSKREPVYTQYMGICASVPNKPVQVPEVTKTATIQKPEDVLEPRESVTRIVNTLAHVESQNLTIEVCMTAVVVLAVGLTYFSFFKAVSADGGN